MESDATCTEDADQCDDIGYLVKSPEHGRPIPEEALAPFLLRKLRKKIHKFGSRVWMADVCSGTSVRFDEVEELSLRVASSLQSLGFKGPGHVLYYVTYEMAQLYVVHLAVWRLGGAVRGCYQGETPEEYERQMRECKAEFVLVDTETITRVQEAISKLEWSVTLLSVGSGIVWGAVSYETMLLYDVCGCPDEVDIDPLEDVVIMPNTSGSTGKPKAVMHTHYTSIAMLSVARPFLPEGSLLTLMTNYAIGNFIITLHSLCSGLTVYQISKFKRDQYFELLEKYRPSNLMVYPFVATWLARSPELNYVNVSHVRKILIGGWVLDSSTAQLLHSRMPAAKLVQIYGMTECMLISCTLVEEDHDTCSGDPFALSHNEGEMYVTSGKLLPHVRGKVVDPATGRHVGRGQKGELWLQTPCIMKGYLVPGKEPNRASVDDDGWLKSGDIGFFDKFGNVYVIERVSFMFKYTSLYVSPSEIEAVLQNHSAVQEAGVVGVPHPATTNIARAYVVVRPGKHVFSSELQRYVASRLPSYKHLHGGVRFVPALPVNRGGKLDRAALKKMAIENKK